LTSGFSEGRIMANPTADPILVIGHRNPDTDAICSALAYAALYAWQAGQPAVACHLDEIGSETAWLLQHVGQAPPRPIADVYLRVRDVMLRDAPALHESDTLREGGLLMHQRNLGALPVVNDAGRLVGLLARDTLADRYLEQLQLSPEIDLPVALLRRTLEAELLAGNERTTLRDRVWIATFPSATARRLVGPGDAVIVDDRPTVQRAALEAGAGCLIVANAAPLPEDVLAAARIGGAIVLRTHHSPFATALLLQQSVPVGRVMLRAPETVHPDDLLVVAQEKLRRVRIASLPVVDEDGTYRGLLLRRHLAVQTQRRVILTDHNHPDQTAPGVTESTIVAIVDHHSLGGLQTLQPLTVICEPVGCSCTLIAELYRRGGAPLPRPLAGAMLGAVLSDTVAFRSPTTTARDRAAAAWLAEVSGEPIEALARAMFRARLPDPPPPASWWVGHDWKVYRFGQNEIGIGQVELTDIEAVMPPVAELRAGLQQAMRRAGLAAAFLMLTDILEQRTLLLVADDAGALLAARAFGVEAADGRVLLPGVMSRKQQVVPPLAAALAE
jgi:manganese-dependent inorganic pyrophosphatase